MSTEQTNPTEPGTSLSPMQDEAAQHIAGARIYSTPEGPQGDETDAARYITAQVQRERIALQRTRIFGIVMLLLLGGEMIYITARFSAFLRPHSAAEIADGMVMQQINDRGPEAAAELKRKIPEYIEQTPDYAMQQLPAYRAAIEDRLETQLNHYCQATAKQLDQHLDDYLTGHKSEIKEMISSGNDPAVTKRVGADLKQQFTTYVQERPKGGESIQDQLDVSLTALQGTAKTLHRLATARDLTPQEKQTRRALAVLTQSLGAQ